MMREIPLRALSFLTEAEGVKLRAYLDSKGVPTIGVGHTGPEVHLGQSITLDEAMALLKTDLEKSARRLANVTKNEAIFELTNCQYAALLSFVFNLGANPEWTIWKRVNAKAFDQVPTEMARFCNIRLKDGTVRKIPGLVNRRNAEIALWAEGEPGTLDVELSPAQTREMVTPPTPNPPTIGKSTVAVAGGAAVVGAPLTLEGVGNAVASVHQQLANVHGFHITKDMIIGALTLAAVFLVVVAGLKLFQHMRAAHQ